MQMALWCVLAECACYVLASLPSLLWLCTSAVTRDTHIYPCSAQCSHAAYAHAPAFFAVASRPMLLLIDVHAWRCRQEVQQRRLYSATQMPAHGRSLQDQVLPPSVPQRQAGQPLVPRQQLHHHLRLQALLTMMMQALPLVRSHCGMLNGTFMSRDVPNMMQNSEGD